jgi:hypothetical protein
MSLASIRNRDSYVYDPALSVFEILARERARQAAIERRRNLMRGVASYIRRAIILVAAVWCYTSRCAIYGYLSTFFANLR